MKTAGNASSVLKGANTFTTASLITTADIAANAAKALKVIPENMELLDHHTALQSAVLCELNRFPGRCFYCWIPFGKEREEAIADVEARAKQWETATKKPLVLTVPFTVQIYVENLRRLLFCVDLERAETAAREGDVLEIEEFKFH